MLESRMILRKRERVLKGAIDLLDYCSRQTSQFSEDSLFIYRFDLFSYDLRSKRETSRALWDDHMTGGKPSRVFRQGHDNNELTELVDAIIGNHDGGTSLFDLNSNNKVELTTTTSPRLTATTGFLLLQDRPGLVVAEFPIV